MQMSWLQILSALAAAYPIPWPIGFTMYAAAIGRPANFDIAGVFAGVFCELRVPVLDEYLVQVITPAVAGFMVIMAWFIARMCGGGFSLDAKNAKLEVLVLFESPSSRPPLAPPRPATDPSPPPTKS